MAIDPVLLLALIGTCISFTSISSVQRPDQPDGAAAGRLHQRHLREGPVVIASAIAAIVVASLHLVASSVGADRML